MNKITEIKQNIKNKNKVSIFVDDEFCCSVMQESVEKNRLIVGQEIDEKLLNETLFESEREIAFNKVLNLICRTSKTKAQIQEYLLKKGFSDEVSIKVIEMLEEYRYIDDNEYAKNYISFYGGTKGKRRIEHELKLKGVSESIIEFNREELPNQTITATTIAKKFMKNREINKDNTNKLYRHLVMKGFDFGVVLEVIKNFDLTLESN